MQNNLKKYVCTTLVFVVVFSGIAQGQFTLKIGDPAPPLKYSKWIKGEPINSWNGNHLYILEFWATWCGPCRAAMPHLTRLQKEYNGRISIIGVDIWEDKKKGQPYEAFLPVVEKFVKENNENMGYSVFADNNDQHMGNNWMKAAGQEGIPSTFIVKDGKIIWIGDPMALDSTLPKIINGSYNMAAFKIKFEKGLDASQELINEWLKATKPIQKALEAREFKNAIALIEKAKVENPDLHYALNRMGFYTLLKHVGQDEAIAFGNQWQEEDKNAAGAILDVVAREADLLKATYLWAANTYIKAGVEVNPFSFHTLAGVFSKAADFTNAVKYEQSAVQAGQAALNESKTGAMTVDILKAYQAALAYYKKGKIYEGNE